MANSLVDPIPEVYVLWHPECQIGEELAREVHRWLRPGAGLGPKVHYRSAPAPEAPPGGLPPPLPGEPRAQIGRTHARAITNLQVLITLIDDHMIADGTWRHWLADLATTTTGTERIVIPVALDPTAFNVVAPIRDKNFLRPKGLPLPTDADARAAAMQVVVRSLQKQLTETLCRILLQPRSEERALIQTSELFGADLSKIRVFLSHAKADGTSPAKRIRDYIYSQTQLAAFYDENDIPYATSFNRIIDDSLVDGRSAAMIAVRSAVYPSRPWCRRELSIFRSPREDVRLAKGSGRWTLSPLLVVDALESEARSVGIPEMGNAPVVRWVDRSDDQDERVVTLLLRDVMLSVYHAAVGRRLNVDEHAVVVNWIPDVVTMMKIPAMRSPGDRHVYYPGRGMTGIELDILEEFFPDATFHSFDEVLL